MRTPYVDTVNGSIAARGYKTYLEIGAYGISTSSGIKHRNDGDWGRATGHSFTIKNGILHDPDGATV